MALAQPTGLKVQALEPLITVEQQIWRYITGECGLLTEAGDELITEGGATLEAEPCTVPLIGVTQLVDDSATLYPAQTLIDITQKVEKYAYFPRQTLIEVRQDVERHRPAETLIQVRQSVLSDQQIAESPLRVYLDGTDITALCSHIVSIAGAEGTNRTATVKMIHLPKGPLNVPSFQGRAIEISRLQDGTLHHMFTGTVDVPRYTRLPPTLTLDCSDLRNERLGKEDRPRLKAMTGGLFSPITQREDATGRQWVDELMRTVHGSLDYTGAGVLRYRPWALDAPRYTLSGHDVFYREAQTTHATRSSIVNRVSATLEYRYYQRNTIAHAVSLDTPRSRFCTGLYGCTPARQVENEDGQLVDQVWPTKAGILQAAQSVSGWALASLEYIPIPPDGWYRDSNDVTRKIAFGATEARRQISAMGADVELERYISQPRRETYRLTIEAPESIDQYGEIEASDMRVAAETRVDPAIFEERGCSVISDPDDRRADVELAIQCLQRMAAKTLLDSHRGNQLAFRYHPKTGRSGAGQMLPVEIGDIITVTATEVQCTGYVTEFQHETDKRGDVWTDIKLAVSRVDSAVSVTEDWSLPAAPGTYKLTPPAPGQLESPDCPAPVGEVSIEGPSRIEPDGTVIIVAPAVDRSQVDEITGTRQHTYSVAIPRNLLSVEVI